MLYARTKRIIIIFGKARRHKLLLVVSLPLSLYAPLSPSLCKPITTLRQVCNYNVCDVLRKIEFGCAQQHVPEQVSRPR